jgi:hypothetical protein
MNIVNAAHSGPWVFHSTDYPEIDKQIYAERARE